ncbi:muscarinic acetylcholine receptor M2-like [Chiloscyllium plagiosum]|uniref:muscarinic acetylcholine receptor M2-like n=1 Tax=Chiloscyllium plagiosum TaxID=36176 RepID=UPI001CB7BAD2|nr:muscarinic acetylcholine receptor M2-like [Chiloscyllium plagiosum]
MLVIFDNSDRICGYDFNKDLLWILIANVISYEELTNKIHEGRVVDAVSINFSKPRKTNQQVVTLHQSELIEKTTETSESLRNGTTLLDTQNRSSYKTGEVIFIAIVTGSLSVVTLVGNVLVIISIKINRQLQTVNNYFIFSLACADVTVGVTMNLFTIYSLLGYWPLGPVVCDLWLAVDYVVTNASSMNLLIISFDRYFCVTKPLSYPVRRTPKVAGMMIAAAWVLSFFVWAPAILFWQFIVGQRTVSEGECYIQFLSNPAVTFGTSIACFYLPVTIMVILYVFISRASKSRIKMDTKESESKKEPVSPSPEVGNILKSNQSNISDSSDGLPQLKMPNGTIHGIIFDHCGEREEEFLSASTPFSMISLNRKLEGSIRENGNVCNTMDYNRLFHIKMVNQSQNSNYHETIADLSSNDGKDRGITKTNTTSKRIHTTAQKRKVTVSREKKVTRTILAILLVFIITWCPYNVMVLIRTFCSICVPKTVWDIGYWIFYINSTINPACYALCNATFKKTFKHIILCQHKKIGAKS